MLDRDRLLLFSRLVIVVFMYNQHRGAVGRPPIASLGGGGTFGLETYISKSIISKRVSADDCRKVKIVTGNFFSAEIFNFKNEEKSDFLLKFRIF